VADTLCQPPLSHQRKAKGEKGSETYKLNIKPSSINNTNITNNIKRSNAKYTKPMHWRPTSSCQAAPGSPGLASAADRNWTQECMDRDLVQDSRQDNKQGPLQKPTMDEEGETLVIPQL